MAQVERLGRSIVVADPPQRTVVAARDRPGLLAAVTGVLALHGLDVRSRRRRRARTASPSRSSGRGRRGDGGPTATRCADDLDAVLAGRLALAERLAEQARAYAGSQRPPRRARSSPR